MKNPMSSDPKGNGNTHSQPNHNAHDDEVDYVDVYGRRIKPDDLDEYPSKALFVWLPKENPNPSGLGSQGVPKF